MNIDRAIAYDDMISNLKIALRQQTLSGDKCNLCGKDDHPADQCGINPLNQMAVLSEIRDQWLEMIEFIWTECAEQE